MRQTQLNIICYIHPIHYNSKHIFCTKIMTRFVCMGHLYFTQKETFSANENLRNVSGTDTCSLFM